MREITYKGRDIIALSDTHGLHNYVKQKSCDIVIHAGDCCAGHTLGPYLDFLDWFSGWDAGTRILVPGNHDIIIEKETSLCMSLAQEEGVDMLINEEMTADGLTIIGSPYTPIFMNWSFMETEENLAAMYFNFPKESDILVTHGPKFGVLDMTVDGVEAGSKALSHYVENTVHGLHIHGHIHEAAGQFYNTYNVATLPQILGRLYE